MGREKKNTERTEEVTEGQMKRSGQEIEENLPESSSPATTTGGSDARKHRRCSRAISVIVTKSTTTNFILNFSFVN